MTYRALPVLAVIAATSTLAVAACSASSAKSEPPSTTTASSITYFKDIKPILDSKCVQCHTAGGIGPFSLKTVDEVKPHLAAIKSAVTARTMPPWLATKGCADYKSDISLSDAQIQTISAWVDAAGTLGSEGDYVAPPAPPATELPRVDATLALPAPYTPSKSPDDYRCFVLDWKATTEKFVTGFQVHPDHPAIVHHAIAYAATPDQVAQYEKLDADEPGEGYTCFGGPGGDGNPQFLAAWAPGGGAPTFPEGTGIKVVPGSKIVLQIHYNTQSAPPAADATTVALRLEDHVDKEGAIVPFLDPRWPAAQTMTIPARMQNVEHSFRADPSLFIGALAPGVLDPGRAFNIYASVLHMHTRGFHGSLKIEHKDPAEGEECLLNIDQWNFHWQRAYQFDKPKVFKPGDELAIECKWNNDLDKALNWGEGTQDEMCIGFVYVTR
jgi:hypothetical protein